MKQTSSSFHQKVTLKKSLKIPKGGNQILFIEAEQTTQWPKEEFEDQISYIEAEQTKQWPKDKSTKGQTTIYKTYI